MASTTDILLHALAALLVAALAWWATGAVRRSLVRHGIYDAPNARSSHTTAKPRGGGLALIPVILLAWTATGATAGIPGGLWWIMALALGLAAVSFADDIRGLGPAPRLAAQLLAVILALTAFEGGPVFQGLLPLWLDRVLAGFLWLWFINLFNFMDGIDGISGVETMTIGLGLTFVALLVGRPDWAVLLPLLVAAAAFGFLMWNWEPSRIFLGDSGSVTLGFLLGWLLLDTAASGLWAVALILPAYYLTDATLTLFKRLLRQEKVWRAHKQHAYQRAVAGGWSHARTTSAIAAANLVLLALALIAAASWTMIAVVSAALVVMLLFWLLLRVGPY